MTGGFAFMTSDEFEAFLETESLSHENKPNDWNERDGFRDNDTKVTHWFQSVAKATLVLLPALTDQLARLLNIM